MLQGLIVLIHTVILQCVLILQHISKPFHILQLLSCCCCLNRVLKVFGWPMSSDKGSPLVSLWQDVISLPWHVTPLTSGLESCCCVESFTSCWFASFSRVNTFVAKSVMHKCIKQPTSAWWWTHIWQTFTQHIIACLHIFLNIKDIKVGLRRICGSAICFREQRFHRELMHSD